MNDVFESIAWQTLFSICLSLYSQLLTNVVEPILLIVLVSFIPTLVRAFIVVEMLNPFLLWHRTCSFTVTFMTLEFPVLHDPIEMIDPAIGGPVPCCDSLISLLLPDELLNTTPVTHGPMRISAVRFHRLARTVADRN